MLKKLRINDNKIYGIQKLSKIFQPIKIIPKNSLSLTDKEGFSKSSKLMLELGIIRHSSPGSYYLLPLGIRALEKLIGIVDDTMQSIGGQKVEFPTLINQKLWTTSGRLNEIGELFKLKDRHNHNYLLGPTHEETASELLSQFPNSYKDFPLLLYQISNKFRDEIKPRLGLLRSKQFIMKDMYSFDISSESAMQTYENVTESYDRLFKRLVEGENGAMGGSLSHEYHYTAEVGEDILLKCTECNYFANAEVVKDSCCPKCKSGNVMEKYKGIEVGHTFLLGDKYTKVFKSNFMDTNGKRENLEMGCYGIGLTRLLAAAIENLSGDNEIRWPKEIAPYTVLIIPPKVGSKEEPFALNLMEPLCNSLHDISFLRNDLIIDNREDLTIGRRIMEANRFGYPFIIVLGNRIKEDPVLFELHDTTNGVQLDLRFEDLISYISKSFR
ncbi:hypothetical protein WA026_007279 [Henosepilachna vigintioctopunctata]|uniref:Probable proline--tRNA ligase, mitochondrial n=1 Tax=Henosepilachna vigintioctopunctata TaxID=420089 RepID=A0AAW1UWT2_9CUCU